MLEEVQRLPAKYREVLVLYYYLGYDTNEIGEILGLRAPLPTMVLNDSEDQLYTLPEMQAADRILAQVFEKAGASDRYKCSYYPGLHKFDADMQAEAFAWFDRWLKG